MTQMDVSSHRLLHLLQSHTGRPGLLSTSPHRTLPSNRFAITPTPQRPRDNSQGNLRWTREKSLKRGLDLFFRITGGDNIISRRRDCSTTNERKSDPIPSAGTESGKRRRKKSSRLVFVHNDKDFIDKLNTSLHHVLLKKKEVVQTTKQMSDVEKLAWEADMQIKSRMRVAYSKKDSQEHYLINQVEGEDIADKSPVDDTVHLSKEITKPTEGDSSPDFQLSPLLFPARLSDDEQRLRLPPLSPLFLASSPQANLRRVIDVPSLPFGTHKPIPQKIETLLLTPAEVRIRKRKQVLKQLLTANDTAKATL